MTRLHVLQRIALTYLIIIVSVCLVDNMYITVVCVCLVRGFCWRAVKSTSMIISGLEMKWAVKAVLPSGREYFHGWNVFFSSSFKRHANVKMDLIISQSFGPAERRWNVCFQPRQSGSHFNAHGTPSLLWNLLLYCALYASRYHYGRNGSRSLIHFKPNWWEERENKMQRAILALEEGKKTMARIFMQILPSDSAPSLSAPPFLIFYRKDSL